MSKAKSKPAKPSKPRPDFPLTPHAGGAWCKKVGGRIYYFGSWGDPGSALKEYQAIKDSLQAGIDPRKLPAGLINVGHLFNLYLHRQKQRADVGAIRFRTWREHRDLCSRVADILGRTTPVVALRPQHFQQLRFQLSKILGPVGLKNSIIRIRGVFKWAFDSEQLPAAVRFGPDFSPPSAAEIRKVRNAAPKRFIEADVLRTILTRAGQPMHAMIMLAINGGLGNKDVATLKLTDAALSSPWLDYPRPKTETMRRIPLWAETMKSLGLAREERPSSDSPLFFVTRFGNPWAWETPEGKFNDEVGKQFRKLVKSLGVAIPGVNFYALRHTFRTVADNATRDTRAIERIMGHVGDPTDMGTHYVEHIDDSRLKAVTDAVHVWLFSKTRGG